MDTNSLIMWAIGAVMIAVGLPLFFVADYFMAPEDKKKEKARNLQVVAIVWVAAGLVIYLSVLAGKFLFK